MDQALITRIVEAALLAANQPLTLTQLHGLFPEEQPAPPDSVEQALEQLRDACAERGVELVEVASGFRYQVKEEVHGWVSRMWTERKTKYTRATLETLALIAYRQPITRGEIEAVRGVAVSSNTIQALEEREWIRVVGHRDVPGKPALFGTTKIFLDYFGLKRLDELPPLSELKDIGELEPQLFMDEAPVPAGLPGPDSAQEDPAQEDSMQENPTTEAGDEPQAADDEMQGDADAEDAADDLGQDDPGREEIPSEAQSSEDPSSEEHIHQEQDETEGADPDSPISSEQKQ
ncbi:SMC-Scp complex subunit ScpB [Pseudoxanthomonas yeongjuensis]|uniref:SMC-Scp complex subunit ScpB n=1 Tax=Pseudoxanthomonas yeongjuensis TaxID=377616 RepID=UPI003CCDBD7D